MARFRLSTSLIVLLSFAAGAALLAAGIALWGVVARFDLAAGPVVIRSQAGMSYPLPVPADGEFVAPVPQVLTVLPPDGERPRNVVLVIGDGMGLGMVSGASALLHGPGGGLALEAAPAIGLVRIYAADALVNDSAGSGTSLATGHKTNRKMVSMLPDGRTVPTLFEKAHARGLLTGVVTTSGLMDATPATFTAHNVSRSNKGEILASQLSSGTDVMIGASWGWFDRLAEEPGLAQAVDAARQQGVMIVGSAEGMKAARAPFVALLPPRADSPDAGGPPLDVSVRKALAELGSDDSGFVLLVETEETDEWGHANDVQRVVSAVEELDVALRVILDFAEARKDTLVIVTADHDTGGMALVRGRAAEGKAEVRWTTDGHVGTWVPLFAFGPGATQFIGVLDNTEVSKRIASLLGLDDQPEAKEPG